MPAFSKLDLNPTILANIERSGYQTPTDIQTKALELILSGADTYATAPTGTGKTAAYLLPLLESLSRVDYSEKQVRPIRALFLVPTRELAAQLEASIAELSQGLQLRSIMICGGTRIESQAKRFKRGTDILIATPKRLIDLLKMKVFSLEHILHFVMDEADRLVTMGITTDINKILAGMPKQKQMILFSATDNKTLNAFSQRHLKDRQQITANNTPPGLNKINHTFYRCLREEKSKRLMSLLDLLDCDRALIFIRTKNDVNQLTDKLNQQGYSCEGLHNEIPQKQRQQRLAGFKNKEFNFLIATDIACRGIDIDDLFYVINYDLPVNANDYVHRIGRTARKGISQEKISEESSRQNLKTKVPVAPWKKAKGKKAKSEFIQGHIFSLVSPEQKRLIEKIQKAIGKEIKLKNFPVVNKS